MWIRAIGMVVVVVVAGGCGDDDDGVVADASAPDAAAAAVDASAPDGPVPDAAGVDAASTDAAGGSNVGFIIPDVIVRAYQRVEGVWVEQGPANYDCLGTPSTDPPTSVPVTLSGAVLDLQTGDPVDTADIAFYDYPDFGLPIATVTADVVGDYSVALPAGTGPMAIEVERSSGYHQTINLPVTLAPAAAAQARDLQVVSALTLNALPAFIGVMRTPGLGIAWGTTVDCDGNTVAGAIATVSNTAGVAAHRGDVQTYYFSAGSTSLPVRLSQQANTNSDGMFTTIEVEPSESLFIQVWGFLTLADRDAGNLTLLCELPAPIRADALTTFVCAPRRS